jgi:hypothetical protein
MEGAPKLNQPSRVRLGERRGIKENVMGVRFDLGLIRSESIAIIDDPLPNGVSVDNMEANVMTPSSIYGEPT